MSAARVRRQAVASASGAAILLLHVSPSNAGASALYRRLGYTELMRSSQPSLAATFSTPRYVDPEQTPAEALLCKPIIPADLHSW